MRIRCCLNGKKEKKEKTKEYKESGIYNDRSGEW